MFIGCHSDFRLGSRFASGPKTRGRSLEELQILLHHFCGGAAPKASKGKGKGPPPPKVRWDDGMATTRMSRREGS